MTDQYVYGGSIFLPPRSPAIPAVKAALQFKNPDYAMIMALRARGKKLPLPPQWIYRCYPIPVGHPWAGGIMAPRHIDMDEAYPGILVIDRTTFPDAEPVVLADGFKLRDYQKESVDLIENFRSGYVVAPCLAGDTIISVNRAGKGFKMTLEDLYRKQNEAFGGWDHAITTKVRSHKGDRIGLNEVVGVYAKGVKKTITIRLVDGKSVRATTNHKVMTPSGWTEAGDLSAGDLVIVDSGQAGQSKAVAVAEVSEGRTEMVYDIACEAPHNNFVANGIVVHNCGAGKTSIGMGAIATVQPKPLVLVHTTDLAQQWVDRIVGTKDHKAQLKMADGSAVSVTTVGDGKMDDSGRVVVALFQTLARMPFMERYEWAKQFGMVVADECHHVPAETFNQVMCCMPAKYRLGLTATPERNDGMQDVLTYQMGIMLKEIKISDLVARQQVVLPKVRFVRTGVTPPEGREWSTLLTELSEDRKRNDLIIAEIMKLLDQGRQVLVLSERVEHCENLAAELQAKGVSAAALVGTMSKANRKDTLQRADSGEYRVLTATTLADEGLDLPGLEAVLLTSPSKAMGRIQQRIGRVMRPKIGKKEPVVLDFIDNHGALENLARRRARLYRSLGCVII